MPTISGTKLSNAIGQFARRYAPAFITLILLAGAFFYYTNVVMENNRKDLLGRSFRGLQSIGGNIREKIQVYAERNSQNFLQDMDSLRQLNSPDTALLMREYGLTRIANGPKEDSGKAVVVARTDDWNIVFARNKSASRAGAPVKEFVQSFLRRDLFRQYFLAYDKNVVFDELNLSHDTIPPIWKGREVKDTLTGEKVTEYSTVQVVEAGGKKYRLFMLPFTVQGTHHFVIGGYMPQEEYDAQCRKIMGIVIMWLVFGIVMVILMFPLLRIFLMNRAERLNARDVLNSMMSIHILGSILTIILVNMYVYWGFIKPQSDTGLKDLATDMQKIFSNEVKDVLDEIKLGEKELVKVISERKGQGAMPTPYPDLYAYNPADSTYKVLRTTNGARGEDQSPYKATWLRTKYPYFEHIIWADSNGRQIIRWTNKNMVPHKVNVRRRDYFQAVMNGTLFRNDTEEYYLTAISSWVAEEKLVSIARPSQINKAIEEAGIQDSATKTQLKKDLSRLKVVSLNAPLRSIFNPVLPYGYGFCMINEDGEVLFHNDPNRSLNENLLKECNDDLKLGSLLNTNASGHFDASYSGSSTRFYVLPVKGMPYYIVTFYNKENIWNQDLDIVSASSILVLLNIGIILLLVLVTRIVNLKALSKAVFFIWLAPKMHRTEAYKKVSRAFLMITGILLGFILFFRAPDGLYLLGVTIGLTYIMVVYSYSLYNYCDWKKRREGTGDKAGIKAFINEEAGTLSILAIVYTIAAFIFLINLTEGAWLFLLTQLIFGLLVFLFNHSGYILSNKEKPANDQRLKRWYHCSVYGFMLATAITPTILFFTLSLREEQKLVLQYQQLDFMNTFLRRKPFDFYKQDSFPRLSYHFPFYHNYVADSIAWEKYNGELKKTNTHFTGLYNAIKPSFSSYAKRIEYLSDTTAGKFAWDAAVMDTLKFRMDVIRSGTFAQKDQRIFVAKRLYTVVGLFLKQSWKTMIMQLLLLGVCTFLFLSAMRWLIDGLIKRVFFFNKPATSPLQVIDNAFIAMQHLFLGPNHMFILGTINSGKNEKIRQGLGLDKPGKKYYELDFAAITSGGKPDPAFETSWKTMTDELGKAPNAPSEDTIVIIRHFENRMNDFQVSREKLVRMEQLLSHKQVRIVISSNSHFENMILRQEKEEGKTAEDLAPRWASVMSNFTVFYHKWTMQKSDSVKRYEQRAANTAHLQPVMEDDKAVIDRLTAILKQKLNDECMHSAFLYSLLGPVRQSLGPVMKLVKEGLAANKPPEKIIEEQFDVFCLKLQTLAHYYYMSLWQSLTSHDQLTLFDIACDELMNRRNEDVAENLHALGVVKINDNATGYSVMNESFRRFILMQIDKKEISLQRGEDDPSHSWNRFQLPVIIIVAAVSLFLFTTQRDAFNNLIAWLGAAAGVIAALLKILDMFSTPKPQAG